MRSARVLILVFMAALSLGITLVSSAPAQTNTYSISGRATDDKGVALAGVRVSARPSSGGHVVASASTDESGAYRVEDLAPGFYNVEAYLEGYETAHLQNLDLRAGSVEGADLALIRYRLVTGTVTEAATQRPLFFVEVVLCDANGQRVRASRTASDGTFEIMALPGEYKIHTAGSPADLFDQWHGGLPYGIHAAVDSESVIVADTDVTDIDFVLEKGRTISGFVRDSMGNPLDWTRAFHEDVSVQVFMANGVILRGTSIGVGGSYSIIGLPPSVYKVRTDGASKKGYYVDEWYYGLPTDIYELADATAVDVTAGDATDISFMLNDYRTISGRVTNLAGSPAENVRVTAFMPSGRSVGEGGWVDGDGHYTIRHLPPGEYAVRTDGAGYLNQWYDRVPVSISSLPPVGAALVSVVAGDAMGVDFALPWDDWDAPTTSMDGEGFFASSFPVISGWARDDCWIARVEYSLDAGITWTQVQTLTPSGVTAARWQSQLGGDTGLADGEYRLLVRAVDGTGGLDPTPVDKRMVIDTILPEYTWDFPTDSLSFLGRGVVVSGTAADGGSGVRDILVRVENSSFGQKTHVVPLEIDSDTYGRIYPGAVSWELPIALPYGVSTLSVQVADAAGNRTSWSEPRTVTAIEGPTVHTVSGAVLAGSGTIFPALQSINDGSPASVRVTPASGYLLDWVKDGNVDVTSELVDGVYTIDSVTSNHHITVAFQAIGFNLVMTVSGGGSIVPSLNENDPQTGVLVDLTAVPDPGWAFQGWSGDCSGADNPLTIVMDEDKAVEAIFVLPANTLVLETGWHMLSGAPGSAMGPGSLLFTFADDAYRSITASELLVGQGYWVKCAESGAASLATASPPLSISLQSGWNLIGNTTAVPLSVPQGLVAFVYGNGGYQSVNVLNPGEGAWVRVPTAREITLAPAD